MKRLLKPACFQFINAKKIDKLNQVYTGDHSSNYQRLFSSSPSSSVNRMTILYGSQTGTAQGIAKTIGMFSGMYGIDTSIRSLEGYKAEDLLKEDHVLFVLATYGSGEMPSTATGFWKSLLTSKSDFSKLKYSIFGLGNSTFDEFNNASKTLDAKLRQLKACFLFFFLLLLLPRP